MTIWILTRALEYGSSDRLCVWLNKPSRQALGSAVREWDGAVLTNAQARALLEEGGEANLGGDKWMELDEEEVIENV